MSDPFPLRNGVLHAEQLSLETLAARHGTPVYVYSRSALEGAYRAYGEALGSSSSHLVCYSVKANSNIAVLGVLARLGAGFDIVSGGELARVLAAGGDPRRIVFSGVGKSAAEITAALRAEILCFNVESLPELELLERLAAQEKRVAGVGIRFNPDIDAGAHPHIATGRSGGKFGLDAAQLGALCEGLQSSPWLRLESLSCHIGSQILSIDPFLAALDFLLARRTELLERGLSCRYLDLGGGLGVRYRDEIAPGAADLVRALLARLPDAAPHLILEPGRSVAAASGVLLTRVLYLKREAHGNFAIVDAAMNDMLRPALYGADMELAPLRERRDEETLPYDVAGPVCESADFFAKKLPLALREGDFLALRGAGAYGFCMSSNYNSRPRAAELMVDGEREFVVRRRESIADLTRGEALLPDSVPAHGRTD